MESHRVCERGALHTDRRTHSGSGRVCFTAQPAFCPPQIKVSISSRAYEGNRDPWPETLHDKSRVLLMKAQRDALCEIMSRPDPIMMIGGVYYTPCLSLTLSSLHFRRCCVRAAGWHRSDATRAGHLR